MDLLRAYHDAFHEYLTNELKFTQPIAFGEQELTWEFLMEEWKIYKYYGLTSAFMFLPCMCANPESIPDMETMVAEDFEKKADKTEEKFADFLNTEHTLPKIYNLAKNYLPA